MQEIPFGENTKSYGVVEKADGWLEIRVYNRNKSWHTTIRANAGKPSYFLDLQNFTGTNPRAKYWLAEIVKTNPKHFAQGRVTFIFAQ